ncbi:MAG: hypothetical protein R8G66_32745 [Cytophagales bacterium]|nr:hypothetical protein [Cytophagales bacterium]
MMRILVLTCVSLLLLFVISCTEEEEPRFIAVTISVVNQASGTAIEGASMTITTSNDFSFQGRSDSEGLVEVSFEATGDVSLSVSASHPSFGEASANEITIAGTQVLLRRTLELSPNFDVTVTPALLDFGISLEQAELVIENTGTIGVSYRAIAADERISLNVPTGSIGAGASQTIQVNLDRSNLEPGTSSGNLIIAIDELGRDLNASYMYRALAPEETNWVDEDKDGLVDIRTIDDLYRLSLEHHRDTFSNTDGFELVNELNFDDPADYRSSALQRLLTEGEGWLPIGLNATTDFNFVFEGNGLSIKNLYINRATNFSALIAYTTTTSEVRNLNIEIKDVSGNEFTAGLIGWSRGKVSDCSVQGNISESKSYCGLLIGICPTGIVEDSYATGIIVARDGNNVGGLIGMLGSTNFTGGEIEISRCYADATVIGNQWVGGFTGLLTGRFSGTANISSCYSRGSVQSRPNRSFGSGTGGFMAFLAGSGNITNCYTTSEVIAEGTVSTFYSGGFLGSNSGNIVSTFAAASFESNSASTYVGGFSGSNNGSIPASNYWDGELAEVSRSVGGTRLGTVQLQGQTTANGIYITWDPLVWDFGTASQYPALKGMPNGLEAQRK